jgi:hypothetical protein
MQFITSHPGPFLMLAIVIVCALVVGATLAATRRLPPEHALRLRVESWWNRTKQDPELAGKRLQMAVFVLIALIFTILTIVYS